MEFPLRPFKVSKEVFAREIYVTAVTERSVLPLLSSKTGFFLVILVVRLYYKDISWFTDDANVYDKKKVLAELQTSGQSYRSNVSFSLVEFVLPIKIM